MLIQDTRLIIIKQRAGIMAIMEMHMITPVAHTVIGPARVWADITQTVWFTILEQPDITRATEIIINRTTVILTLDTVIQSIIKAT